MNYYKKYLKYKNKYLNLKNKLNQKGGELWTDDYLKLKENDGEKLLDFFSHVDRHGKLIDNLEERRPFVIPDNIILGLNESCGCTLTESMVNFYNPLSYYYFEEKIMDKNEFIRRVNLNDLKVQGGNYVILKPGSTICDYHLGNNGKFYDFTNGISYTKFGSDINEIYYPLEFYNNDYTFTSDILKYQLKYIFQYLLKYYEPKDRDFINRIDIRLNINAIKRKNIEHLNNFSNIHSKELLEKSLQIINALKKTGFMEKLEKHKYFSFYKNFLLEYKQAEVDEEIIFDALIETLLYIDKYRPLKEISENFKVYDLDNNIKFNKIEIAKNDKLWKHFSIINDKSKTSEDREAAWKLFLDIESKYFKKLWKVINYYNLNINKEREDITNVEIYYFIIFIHRKNDYWEDSFYLKNYLDGISDLCREKYPDKFLYVHLNSCQGGKDACLVNNCYKLMLSSNYNDNFTVLNDLLKSLTFIYKFETQIFELNFIEGNNFPILTFPQDNFIDTFKKVFVEKSKKSGDLNILSVSFNKKDIEWFKNIVSLLYLFMEISVTFNSDNQILYDERHFFIQFDKLLKNNGDLISTKLIKKFYKYEDNEKMISLILYILNDNLQYRINILNEFVNFLNLLGFIDEKGKIIKFDFNFENYIRDWFSVTENYKQIEEFFKKLRKDRISLSVYNNYSLKYFYDIIKKNGFVTDVKKIDIKRDTTKPIFKSYYESMDIILNLTGEIYNFNYKLEDITIKDKKEREQEEIKNQIKELLLKGLINTNDSDGSYETLKFKYKQLVPTTDQHGFPLRTDDREKGSGWDDW